MITSNALFSILQQSNLHWDVFLKLLPRLAKFLDVTFVRFVRYVDLLVSTVKMIVPYYPMLRGGFFSPPVISWTCIH